MIADMTKFSVEKGDPGYGECSGGGWPTLVCHICDAEVASASYQDLADLIDLADIHWKAKH